MSSVYKINVVNEKVVKKNIYHGCYISPAGSLGQASLMLNIDFLSAPHTHEIYLCFMMDSSSDKFGQTFFCHTTCFKIYILLRCIGKLSGEATLLYFLPLIS